MPNGTYGGVRGRRNSALLDFLPFRERVLKIIFKSLNRDLFIGAFVVYGHLWIRFLFFVCSCRVIIYTNSCFWWIKISLGINWLCLSRSYEQAENEPLDKYVKTLTSESDQEKIKEVLAKLLEIVSIDDGSLVLSFVEGYSNSLYKEVSGEYINALNSEKATVWEE